MKEDLKGSKEEEDLKDLVYYGREKPHGLGLL